MLLCRLLIDWSAGDVDCLGVKLLRLPNEVLEQVVLVLGEHEQLCLLDNLSNVGDQRLAVGRELFGRVRDGRGSEEAV